jgi:hypothetical protein
MIASRLRFGLRLLLLLTLVACAASAPEGTVDKPLAPQTTETIDNAPPADSGAALHAATTSSAAPVAATGPSEPPWAIDKQGDRIGSKSFRTWIWDQPMRSRKHAAIAMRVGTSVKLKSKTPVQGQGCNGKWYAIRAARLHLHRRDDDLRFRLTLAGARHTAPEAWHLPISLRLQHGRADASAHPHRGRTEVGRVRNGQDEALPDARQVE